MASIFGNYQARNDINTWISSIYCEKWGLKEGLRELLQNQRDELINLLGKENIETQALNDKYQFNFFKRGTSEMYGSIRYDELRQVLSLENKGKLETFNLLLGGTTRNPLNNNSITGQFGEGLKIAAISLLRLNKPLSIINTNQVWRFSLKNDINFVRNGQPEKCLFWRWEEYDNPQHNGKVIVQIRNITKEEWLNTIDNYLWLVSKVKRLGIVNAGNYGDIILSPEFKDRIFSRGVFVTSVNGFGFGYNLDLPLDRDRNCITNYSDFQTKANKIIYYVIDNYQQYITNFSTLENIEQTEIDMLDEFPNRTYNLLNQNASIFSILYSNSSFVSQNAADFFWKLNALKKRTTDNRFNIDEMSKIPQPLDNTYELQSLIKEKLLPDNFYEYFTPSSYLFYVLRKSRYYESHQARFNRLYRVKRIITPQSNIESNINSVVEKIRLIDLSFNRNKIVFQEFDAEDTYYCENGKYYFSSLLLQNPQKLEEFIFGKCLDILRIKISDLLVKFRITPK